MFKGGMNFGGGGNMQNLMRQAQKMQEQMAQQAAAADEKLESSVLTSASGGGMVEASVNGHKKLLSVKIKPEVVDPDDVEMLEDLIIASINDALNKADELEKSLKPNLNGGF